MSDREIKFILCALILVLAVFYGALAATLQIFPYSYIKPHLTAADSVKRAFDIDAYSEEIRWPRQELSSEGGVAFSDPAFTFSDVVVLTTTHDSIARLVDRRGRVLHEWNAAFSRIWDNQDHIVALFPLKDDYFYLRDSYLYPNGDILLLISAGGVTPWGMGLVKLDKDSNVLWKHTGYVNNDFEVAPDGTIYLVEHEVRDKAVKDVEFPFMPFLEDNIVMLDSQGKELRRISLIDAIEASSYKDLLKQVVNDRRGDPTHSNSIEYVERDFAQVPWLKEGNLLISVRNLNALVVLDPRTGKIPFAEGLVTRMQHDVDLLENGHLLFFDNRGSFTAGGYSRVIEIDPRTQEILWMYDGTLENPFESEFWGEQERFANGNTLIVKAENGRLVEVTPEQRIIWDYRLPMRKTIGGQSHMPVVTHADFIPRQSLSFEFNKIEEP